ncbi:MAG: AraC family transcriptional regulator, partial [Anaerobutyricum sp.]|nr:AraC family transcriptional regulator [Anaerobutyricum sp.]
MTTLKHILEMEEILAYIMNHLEEDLPVSRTAEYFQYNEAYFSKKFSDYFGMPYGKFLAGLRLRKAAEEITEGKTTFKEIARKYGYGDTRSFSKAFKREIGMSPRQFREENVSVPDMP